MNKELIKNLAGLLKVKPEDLTAAIEKEDGKIELPKLNILTDEELSTRDSAQRSEGKKEGVNEGKTIGKELAVKDMKSAFGVEFDGKDLTKLVESVKTQLAKGDEGLKQQVTLLQEKLTQKDTEIGSLKQAAESIKLDAQLLSSFPKDRKSLLSDSEYLTLVKSSIQVEDDNGKLVVKKNGEILRDAKTTNPLGLGDAITSVFKERGWVEEAKSPASGRGGGDKGATGVFTKLSELQDSWKSQGKNVVSAEFQQEVQKIVKENPDFDLMN